MDETPETPLAPEDLLPEGEAMVPEDQSAPAPADPEAALASMVAHLTPEQARVLEGLIAQRRQAAAPPAPRPLAVSEPQAPTMWVRFAIPGLGYFTYHGTNYDRGQLMPLAGGPRDEQLVRLGYVQPVIKEEKHLQAQCGACGLWFLNEMFRDAHGRLRHSDRFAPNDLDIGGGMEGPDGGAALRDVTGDADERRMQQQYPLYLERTKATLESSGA